MYQINDVFRAAVTFTDENGTAADPTTVLMKYKKPGASAATYTYLTDAELVKDSTGVYHVDLTLDIAGRWHYRFEGSGGSVTSATEDAFIVDRSAFS